MSDLFGDEACFADAEAFWAHQNTALAAIVEQFKADGWADVIVMDQGAWFATWDHRTTSKSDGGKVFVTTTTQGEVTCHKGYITSAKRKHPAAGSTTKKTDTSGTASPG